jgi:hypothetical protein
MLMCAGPRRRWLEVTIAIVTAIVTIFSLTVVQDIADRMYSDARLDELLPQPYGWFIVLSMRIAAVALLMVVLQRAINLSYSRSGGSKP